jgi:hypothetical protein
MKMMDDAKQPETSNEIGEQQKTIQNMDKLFKTATSFFLKMYDTVKPFYGLPDL